MSFLLDQRTFGRDGLLRAVRGFVCGYPQPDTITINQGAGGSVGSGEAYASCGPTARTGRLRLTCTTGGGDGVAIFSVAYTAVLSPDPGGSPPAGLSPELSPLYPSFASSLRAGEQYVENDVWLYVETDVDWVVGNFIDIDLIPSTNTTPWAEKRFVGNENFSPQFSEFMEWFAQGPGDGSPQSNITISWYTRDSGSNIRNIQMTHWDAFSDTSPETPFASQPNPQGNYYIYSNEAGMDWWITCNSRRFMGAVRHNTGVWQAFYHGFFEPLAGTVSYPYPICTGGNGNQLLEELSWVAAAHSSFWDPCNDTSGNDLGSLRVREPTGGSQHFANKTGSTTSSTESYNSAVGIQDVIYPWGDTHQVGSQVTTRGYLQRHTRTPVFGSPQQRRFTITRNALFSRNFAGGAAQSLGFLDGVFHITADQASGINGGDTFTLESPEVTYLVVQNTYRGVTTESLCAMRMDPD